jgi:hypothetical protein
MTDIRGKMPGHESVDTLETADQTAEKTAQQIPQMRSLIEERNTRKEWSHRS